MTTSSAQQIEESTIGGGATLDESLNAYDIANASKLEWQVRVYSVRPAHGHSADHRKRGDAKNAIWALRKENAGQCSGWGFVVDVDATKVVVPDTWRIPADGVEVDGLIVTFEETLTASVSNPAHRRIVEGIIREGLKKHFKGNVSDELGDLWQDFNSFCQSPVYSDADEFAFCRRFSPFAKFLKGNRLVVQLMVNTVTVDQQSFSDYYRRGDVRELADYIEAKRANRLNRDNRPIAIRVLHDQSTDHQAIVEPLELSAPDAIGAHATLSRHEQQALAGGMVGCRKFKRDPFDVSMNEVRLILDTQITRESHDETIIDPVERDRLCRALRNFIDGTDIFGQKLLLSDTCVRVGDFSCETVLPPAIRVRDKHKGESEIAGPSRSTDSELRKRVRERASRIRSHGFLQSRPIKPLLAVPKWFGKERAKRMASDLTYIWKSQAIDYRFDCGPYHDAHDLARWVEKEGYDAVLVVLPESSRRGSSPNDTHDQIKKAVTVPTQCIHHNNTLPDSWVDKRPREFSDAEPRLASRIRQRYNLCLGNLLVKHHWVPFAPTEPFYYNVHVGIDVGGRHNNTAMVCLGHGFAAPTDDIVFLPDEIPIDTQKAEPIPTDSLFNGLRSTFQALRTDLHEAKAHSDFNRVLFFRDGHFLGDKDEWNELDAIHQLHSVFQERGWIDESAIWTAVEVLKSAEGWRLIGNTGAGPDNPLVGRCVFPFDDESLGLVCTTGRPYLSQGTACPLRIRIRDIAGTSSRSEVVRDLVWEADMCFTKLDMGMRLPWVLNVADSGALQASKRYKISGIPA